MIVEFSVKNFRSIKDLQTISFAATPLKSAPEYAEVDENNIVEEGGMRLLKTVGIYGPNSSGKSNIIKAFQHFIYNHKAWPTVQHEIKIKYINQYIYDNSNTTYSKLLRHWILLPPMES